LFLCVSVFPYLRRVSSRYSRVTRFGCICVI
jgi:hypothetical protein